MTAKKTLPADVYDTLEFGATVFRGIGAGYAFENWPDVPHCVNGLAAVCEDTDIIPEIVQVLVKAGIRFTENDHAVDRINQRKGRPSYARVSFEEWCKELNVVRGQ